MLSLYLYIIQIVRSVVTAMKATFELSLPLYVPLPSLRTFRCDCDSHLFLSHCQLRIAPFRAFVAV